MPLIILLRGHIGRAQGREGALTAKYGDDADDYFRFTYAFHDTTATAPFLAASRASFAPSGRESRTQVEFSLIFTFSSRILGARRAVAMQIARAISGRHAQAAAAAAT